jgi:hypothetical protein
MAYAVVPHAISHIAAPPQTRIMIRRDRRGKGDRRGKLDPRRIGQGPHSAAAAKGQ